jgi:uncharacterized protein YdcH (DUF465 family)
MYIIREGKREKQSTKGFQVNKIVDFLMNASGCSFANVTTETDPINHTKANDAAFAVLFGSHESIKKIGNRNVSIGNTYEDAVNNRLDKVGEESTFVVDTQSRAWSEKVTNGLVRHKTSGEYYLEYYYLNANESTCEFVWENGDSLTEAELALVKPLFKKPSVSKKQEEAGLDKKDQVKVNLVKIENVRCLKAFGETIYN